MNQLSGKIRFVYLRDNDKNFFIHHKGRKQKASRGVSFWMARVLKYDCRTLEFMKIKLTILYTPIKSMFDYPQIDTQKRRDFYVDFKYTFHRKNPYIMKNDEIPFEFMVQPPLPCCADTHPIQDNNISFQQSLWGNL